MTRLSNVQDSNADMSSLGTEYASPQLVWHLIRGNNSYLKKNLNRTYFSYEPTNLAGTHSYKYSGVIHSILHMVKLWPVDLLFSVNTHTRCSSLAALPSASSGKQGVNSAFAEAPNMPMLTKRIC